MLLWQRARIRFQHPSGGSQPFIAPVPGEVAHSSELLGTRHAEHTNPCKQSIHAPKINELK